MEHTNNITLIFAWFTSLANIQIGKSWIKCISTLMSFKSSNITSNSSTISNIIKNGNFILLFNRLFPKTSVNTHEMRCEDGKEDCLQGYHMCHRQLLMHLLTKKYDQRKQIQKNTESKINETKTIEIENEKNDENQNIDEQKF